MTARAGGLCGTVVEVSQVSAAVLSLSEQDGRHRLSQLREHRALVDRERLASAVLVRAELAGLRDRTAEQATALVAECTPVLLSTLAGQVRDLPIGGAALEDRALVLAANLIRCCVDQWRVDWAVTVEQTVAALREEVVRQLDGHIASVREAASALFAFDLVPAGASGGMAGTTQVGYTFEPDVEQTEALAEAMCTRLPGAWGGRRVERHVLRRAADLLERHAGRARADVAARLVDIERQMLRERDERYAAGTAGIVDAIERAGRLHAERREQVDAGRAQALGRAASARRLRDLFAQLTAGGRRGRPDVGPAGCGDVTQPLWADGTEEGHPGHYSAPPPDPAGGVGLALR